MEQKLDKILSELQNTNELHTELTKGQKELIFRMENLETGQAELSEGQRELTKSQRN